MAPISALRKLLWLGKRGRGGRKAALVMFRKSLSPAAAATDVRRCITHDNVAGFEAMLSSKHKMPLSFFLEVTRNLLPTDVSQREEAL
jgi:hypothetical protein